MLSALKILAVATLWYINFKQFQNNNNNNNNNNFKTIQTIALTRGVIFAAVLPGRD